MSFYCASAGADLTDYQSHCSKVLIRYVAHLCVIKSLINHTVLKRWHWCTPPAAAKYGCSVIVQKTPEVRHLPTSSSMNKLSFYFHFLHWKFVVLDYRVQFDTLESSAMSPCQSRRVMWPMTRVLVVINHEALPLL